MKLVNIIFGLIAIALCIFALDQISEFPEAVPGEIGADFFPKILSYGLGMSGIVLIVTSFLNHSSEKAEPFKITDKSTQRVIIALGITILYCLSLELLGFITCTIIFLIMMMLLMRERAPLRILIVSSTITGSVFIIFSQFLNILLPMGTIYGY